MSAACFLKAFDSSHADRTLLIGAMPFCIANRTPTLSIAIPPPTESLPMLVFERSKLRVFHLAGKQAKWWIVRQGGVLGPDARPGHKVNQMVLGVRMCRLE